MSKLRLMQWLVVWSAAALMAAAQGGEPTQAERMQRYREMQQAAATSLKRIEQKVHDEHERMLKASGDAADDDRIMSLMFQVHELDKRQIEGLRLEMVGILGDRAPAGFKPESRLNLESVLPYPDAPAMDGLIYEDAAKNGSVVVVPISLLDEWLRGPRWAGKARQQAIAELLDAGDVYLHTGGHLPWGTVAARLPVRPPTGAEQAGALLMDDSQPIYYLPPSRIVVAVIDRDRFYVAKRKLQVELPGSGACAKRHHDLVRLERIEAAKSGYRACYTQLVRNRPEFAQAVREAQALIDRLRPPEAAP